ncbi:sodium:solute symporter family protein [Pseudomaricurvus alkylphenolicus]|jgi:SSS family solute:Na+ symporter|uniref:sodium:solute symporter family protein n=1 Tax=Pseudomaricurvus alkylphenolicus TaxID=1306991 RepID=UPI001423C351|nr:sodium:solute symporter family protein [Pseudomaricurvus alkylphenolicus]NIB40886.1 sodium:solute symporter family protein [Pseudomaricurvus alkylphenolicus]
MQYGIIIAVFVYEIAVIAGVGWYLARKEAGHAHQEGDFALGGRSLPVSVVAVTMALTVLGTAHILGVFEMAWTLGASAVWFSIAHVILLVVVCASTGLWVRRMGVSTVPEILETFFGRNTRLLVSCVMAGVIFGILTIETQGIGIIIASMTGWEISNGAVIGGIVGIFYVVLAGIKEVGWVNLVNAVVMYIGLILATVFLAFKLPGGSYESVANYYTDTGNDFMLSIYGTPEILLTFGLGTVIAVVFSQGINQMLLQPTMAAKDEKTIKKALWIAAPVNGLFGVFAVVIGLAAKSMPEFEALGPKVAATTMLVNLLPGWLAALLLASFLAAILSTFAMTSLSPATIFTMDIYKRLYRPDADEAECTRVIRITIVVLAAIAMAVAAYLPPILAAMNWLFSWLVPIFWVVVFGFIWKRSAAAAILTLISAWLTNSAWSFTSLPEVLGMASVANAYVTLGVTLVVGVVANLMFPGQAGYFRSDEYHQKFNAELAVGGNS